jgi:hypothetical protein
MEVFAFDGNQTVSCQHSAEATGRATPAARGNTVSQLSVHKRNKQQVFGRNNWL